MLLILLLSAIPIITAYFLWGYWGLGISIIAVYIFFCYLGRSDIENIKVKPVSKGFKKRKKSAVASLGLDDKQETLILDTETTGLDDNAEIIEIAIVRLDGSVVMNTLVNPEGKIPRAATAIHGITNKIVVDAPNWSEIYEEYRDVTHNKRILVYNASFDKRLVRQTCKLYGLSMPRRDWRCVMLSYAEYFGETKYDSYTWQKLSNALVQMGIEETGQAHRAFSDCIATSKLIQAMVNAG